MNATEIWRLYDAGKFSEARGAAEAALRHGEDSEVRAILAWSCYRAQEFELAFEHAGKSEHPRATACRMYILAYVERFRDDTLLESLLSKIPGDIDAANAIVIRARQKDSALTRSLVLETAKRFPMSESGGMSNVSLANLLHNTARFLMEKSNDALDQALAVTLLRQSLRYYGVTGNWHHRAAANFWLAHANQAAGNLPEALEAALRAVQLWDAQISLDGISQHQAKRRSAADLLVEISQAIGGIPQGE